MSKIIQEDIENIINSDLDWYKFKKSNILLTGATGLIGQYILRVLIRVNEKFKLEMNICCFTRSTEKFKNIFNDIFNSSLYYSDIINENIHYDYIIHMASPASSHNYLLEALDVINLNVMFTNKLLSLSQDIKGLLYFSSGEVSGQTNKEIITENDYGYLDPTDIRNCYGESKRMAENLCQSYYHKYSMPIFCVRPEHIYGPSIDLKNDKRVYSEFITNIINNENIIIKSDGLSSRNFCYITDAMDGFFRVLLKGQPGQSYNVGNREGKITIRDLANLLISMYPEKKLSVSYKKQDNMYLENRVKNAPILSTKKLDRLGYNCKVSLQDGFSRTIKNFI